MGKIADDYNILGHRQTSDTDCPGDVLYRTIQTWENWVRDLLYAFDFLCIQCCESSFSNRAALNLQETVVVLMFNVSGFHTALTLTVQYVLTQY